MPKASRNSVKKYQENQKAEEQEKSLRERLEAAGLPMPRSLNRGQVKKVREEDLDPIMGGTGNSDKMVNLMDWILDNVYAEQITDETDYALALELAVATYELTYGGLAGRKN